MSYNIRKGLMVVKRIALVLLQLVLSMLRLITVYHHLKETYCKS